MTTNVAQALQQLLEVCTLPSDSHELMIAKRNAEHALANDPSALSDDALILEFMKHAPTPDAMFLRELDSTGDLETPSMYRARWALRYAITAVKVFRSRNG